jgi:hypothetical protein
MQEVQSQVIQQPHHGSFIGNMLSILGMTGLAGPMSPYLSAAGGLLSGGGAGQMGPALSQMLNHGGSMGQQLDPGMSAPSSGPPPGGGAAPDTGGQGGGQGMFTPQGQQAVSQVKPDPQQMAMMSQQSNPFMQAIQQQGGGNTPPQAGKPQLLHQQLGLPDKLDTATIAGLYGLGSKLGMFGGGGGQQSGGMMGG